MLLIREEPRAEDRPGIRELLEETGFFPAHEIDVAIELVDDRLARGTASDYRFLVAEDGGRIAGFSCFGRITVTRSSFDLYWLAVRKELQGRGVGRWLLAESEARMAAAGAGRVYVETSTRELYEPTRRFYVACGYRLEATLAEFYGPGDGKAVFVKVVGA